MSDATFDDLNRRSSKELHDLAFRYAERHLDVRFFWNLLEAMPAAEAATGRTGEADAEIANPAELVSDAVTRNPGTLDGLRPIYIDYLSRHPDALH